MKHQVILLHGFKPLTNTRSMPLGLRTSDVRCIYPGVNSRGDSDDPLSYTILLEIEVLGPKKWIMTIELN